MKEIAVYVNCKGETASISEAGFIKVFYKDTTEWKVKREIQYIFNDLNDKEEIRIAAIRIAEALGNCKIFVAREFSDIIYKMLSSMGFNAWKMEGNPDKYIEYIFEKEIEEAEEIKLMSTLNLNEEKQNINPIEIGNNGLYIFNLKELQEHNIGITSKQALKPFLNMRKFNELIITCNHIPIWLEDELSNLNLSFEVTKTGEDDYIIIINNTL